MNDIFLIEVVQRSLCRQAEAVAGLARQIDPLVIVQVVQNLMQCQGRAVLTGMGKMGAIGRKAASTFSSTGSPALFVQPSEALHGDLGMITKSDLVFALSYSGETDEVLRVVETVQPWGVGVIAITGAVRSTLARQADWVLDISVSHESTDLVAIPSCSTTVAMALCDSIAIAAMELRGFGAEDFAVLHPGGSLGRKLRTTVSELMHSGDRLPLIDQRHTLRQAIGEISRKGLGATLIESQSGQLAGLLTDGDVRRILEKWENPLDLQVESLMTKTPRTCEADWLAVKALALMESHRINVLPVTCGGSKIAGIVHFHDLMAARIA